MDINEIKQVLFELLSLAGNFNTASDIDPNISPFTVALIAIARRDFPIIHTLSVLVDDPLSGDAIMDLSRRVFEDMISVEFMITKNKQEMAMKFIKYAAVERYLNLEYLRKMGAKVDPDVEQKAEKDFLGIRQEFLFKGDQIARSWSKTQFEDMVKELIKAGVINEIQVTDLLQGYTLGNRKNHLSSEDASSFADENTRKNNLEHSLKMGLVITIVSYIRILSRYAGEINDQIFSNKLDGLFSRLNIPKTPSLVEPV